MVPASKVWQTNTTNPHISSLLVGTKLGNVFVLAKSTGLGQAQTGRLFFWSTVGSSPLPVEASLIKTKLNLFLRLSKCFKNLGIFNSASTS